MIEEFSGFEAHDFALRAQYGVEDIGDSGTIYRSMEDNVKAEEFKASVAGEAPPAGLSTPLAALWWEAKGDWARAHGLVDELETGDGTAVHAYLHRKEGSSSNAEYWYGRAGRGFYRPTIEAEWSALVEGLLSGNKAA